jgi:hypothetical protein
VIVLHIGVHKTGSSSLQHYLGCRRSALEARGLAFYTGTLQPDNHIDLYLSALEPGRDSLALRSLDLPPRDLLTETTRTAVAAFARAHPNHTLIYSCEGLSLLRSPAELARLAELVTVPGRPLRVVMALRDKAGFLEAYRKQILKVPGRQPSSDPASALYVAPDSWLADFDALQAAFSAQFGAEALQVIDFDAELARCGDVLPALLRAMTLPEDLVPAPGTAPRQNTSSLKNRVRQAGYRLLHRLRRQTRDGRDHSA